MVLFALPSDIDENGLRSLLSEVAVSADRSPSDRPEYELLELTS